MKIEAIGPAELRQLYKTRLKKDFPPSELRPFSNMSYLYRHGAYRALVGREGEEICAYALLATGSGPALLDYFAVAPQLRGRGIGSAFLRQLPEADPELQRLPFLLIEAESPESADSPEETEQRQRRLRFYRRCGCLDTAVCSELFGVEYRILLLPLAEKSIPSGKEIKTALEGLYRKMIPPIVSGLEAAFRRVCRVFLRPELKEDEARDFARELSYHLTALHRSRSRFMGERLKEYGFSGAMYMILLRVDRSPGSTQDSIATTMYIDKSNVTRRIQQLEELGCVQRETDPNDRRQNRLYLTDRGRELVPLIRANLAEWGRSITGNLTEEEKAALIDLLGKLDR